MSTLVTLYSCSSSSSCLVPNTTSLHVALSRWNGSAYVDSFMAQGRVFFGPQGTYMGTWKNTARFTMPMAPQYDSIQILIQADTLDILPEHQEFVDVYYQRNLRFVSSACGYFTEYTLDSVRYTGYILDTVQILEKKVTTDINPTHLRFVLKS
ncbi:MAG: hypothetical protein FGM54_11975 [Chitinophagaceae bacterium]|nr:hypothetical protein [Chitinophagaceae bacterium]